MKLFPLALLIMISTVVYAQNNQVVNSYNYLKSKEYDKAKAAADAAAANESTKSGAKTWLYRGKVYQAIYLSKNEAESKLDNEAQEKAVESFSNCITFDKDNVYKEEAKALLLQSGIALYNKAKNYADNNDIDKANKSYDLLETAMVNNNEGFKSSGITKEAITYNRYIAYSHAGNKDKMKEYGDKMVELKCKEPSVYIDMAKVSLADKDTVKALSYIDKGKMVLGNNKDLMTQEINIYLAQKKTGILKSKITEAIAASPNNEGLHAVLANLYEKTNEPENAEKEYLKALEIKPDYEIANYNLGALYFNMGNDWNKKMNDLPLSETAKAKEYETKSNEYFKKAADNFEKSYAIAPDAATKQRLRKLYLKLGDTANAEKYK